ncbi:MAG TPA: TIGR00282 family metallophosphoesterase [Dehalococcoidia bacterium]|nr:TIGR00282 family metallophosphoesterase [Dehalococcoidia bacterium]
MKLLFLGDIVGSCGRKAVVESVPRLRRELELDYVVANGENVAGGRGITESTALQLFDCGIDIISGGNHTFQHRDSYEFLDHDARILRPINYPPGAPGRGIANTGDLTVVNVMGRTFMGGDFDDPFRAVDAALETVDSRRFVLVDFHAEATSEKQALGWHLDGRVAAVIGTHTHVPTADHRVLPQGTGYCTDAGMCGARDSVIGDDVDAVLTRFLTQMPTRLPAADGPAIINGVLLEIDRESLRTTHIERHDLAVN